MMNIFHEVSQECSRITTEKYSTSFSSAIRLLHSDLRTPIYNIYGFVRFADEIVDTFHDHEKHELLMQFKKETYDAINRGISLNPILHSFQITVNQYNIDYSLIEAFFKSMEFDLSKQAYDEAGYIEYIYGSAEVVGLMCLYVFCEGDRESYDALMPHARSLGAAFQKVNFLRDVKSDFHHLNRVYFPGVDFSNFTARMKNEIEEARLCGDHTASVKSPFRRLCRVQVLPQLVQENKKYAAPAHPRRTRSHSQLCKSLGGR
jgi:15-cis-phytoene synthase